MKVQFAIAASSLILSAGLSLAAPARAIYYTDENSICRMNPDGTGKVTLFPNAITESGFENLQLDIADGKIYWVDNLGTIFAGNLDGTGATEIHSGTGGSSKITGIAPVAGSEAIYCAENRGSVFKLEPSTGTQTIIYTPNGGIRDYLIFPDIYYEPISETVYWHTLGPEGSYWSSTTGGAVNAHGLLPALTLHSEGSSDSNFFAFEGSDPVPFSWVRGNMETFFVSGGLDENELVSTAVEHYFNPSPEFAIDLEAEFVYFTGLYRPSGGGVDMGLYRTKLDGSEFVEITPLTTFGFSRIALDTADLTDTDDPTVSIFSPFGGTTNNQKITIIGNASDASPILSTTWFHDGEEQGSVDLFNGDFTVTPVTLHPGANTLRIESTDIAGNTGSAEVTVTWEPLRKLEIVNTPAVQEGKRVTVQTLLDHPGDVAGMTFTLGYDPAFLGSPQVSIGGVLSVASPSFNTQTAGEITATFASPGVALPAGEHVLINTVFRARSVPSQTTTDLALTVADVSDANGTPITIGTYAGHSSLVINPRQVTGDINANNRLDIGDSSLMQSMLTGSQETRAWDHLINDLNGSTTLDSGDAIRVLRAVVGLDPQPPVPGARSATKSGFAKSTGTPASGPRARLVSAQNHGAPGEDIVISIELEDMTTAFSGATFTIDYPADALRLTSGGSHTPGTLVAGDSFLLWNVAPSQNDYANQTGLLSFGASSAAPWPGSASGGTLAQLRFAIQPGSTAQAAWPITIRGVEVTTGGGFDVEPVSGDTLAVIGTPISYADYLASHLTPGQIADPGVSGWGADADNDGDPNGAEYASGSLLNDPSSRVKLEPFLQTGTGGEHCIALRFTRDLRAVDAAPFAQTSTDLTSWLTHDEGNPTVELAEIQQSIGDATEVLTFVTRQTLSVAPLQLIRLALPAPE